MNVSSCVLFAQVLLYLLYWPVFYLTSNIIIPKIQMILYVLMYDHNEVDITFVWVFLHTKTNPCLVWVCLYRGFCCLWCRLMWHLIMLWLVLSESTQCWLWRKLHRPLGNCGHSLHLLHSSDRELYKYYWSVSIYMYCTCKWNYSLYVLHTRFV